MDNIEKQIEKKIEDIIDPYNKESKTFFAIREEQLKRKREKMSEEELLQENIKIKNESKASRKKKQIKPKKEKIVKPKKEKKIKKDKQEKVKLEKLFYVNNSKIFLRLFITALLVINIVVFSSFVESYNFKFIIFYENGIEFDDRFASFVMYASGMIIIFYNVFAFWKSSKYIIWSNKKFLFKTFGCTLKDNLNDVKINIIQEEKYFKFNIGIEKFKLKNKYFEKFTKASKIDKDN